MYLQDMSCSAEHIIWPVTLANLTSLPLSLCYKQLLQRGAAGHRASPGTNTNQEGEGKDSN